MSSNLLKVLRGRRAGCPIENQVNDAITMMMQTDERKLFFIIQTDFLLFSSSFHLGTRIEEKASENASRPVLEESLREINRRNWTRSITASWNTVQPAITWKNSKNLLRVEALLLVKSLLKVLKFPDKIQRIHRLLAKVRLFSP